MRRPTEQTSPSGAPGEALPWAVQTGRGSCRRATGACAAVVALGAWLVAGPAVASPTFPAVVEGYWHVSSLPVPGQGCRLCHSTDAGVTVTQPFGKTVRALGARDKDNASLRSALDRVRVNGYDSDGDGIADYQELAIDETNPSDPHSFVAPPVMIGEGGAGGAGEGGFGGEAPRPPAPPTPPPLPPLLEHGCSFGAAGKMDTGVELVLAFLFLPALLRARREARRDPRPRG